MKEGIYQAIILRTKELGESDLLVSFITPESGRIKAIAKGAKKSKKRFVNALSNFYQVNIELSKPRRGKIPLILSAKLINPHRGILKDYRRMCIAGFLIELTEALFPWGAGDIHIFHLLKDSLDSLSEDRDCNSIPYVFEIKAMAIGGFKINTEECAICKRTYMGKGKAIFRADKGGIACMKCDRESRTKPELSPDTVKVIKEIYSLPFNQAKEIQLTEDITHELLPFIIAHRQYRLERPISTWKYIE